MDVGVRIQVITTHTGYDRYRQVLGDLESDGLIVKSQDTK